MLNYCYAIIQLNLDTGDHLLIDVDNRPKSEIYEHLIQVLGKTK